MARKTKAEKQAVVEIEASARVRWENERKVKAQRAAQALSNLELVLSKTIGLPVCAEDWTNEINVIRTALG